MHERLLPQQIPVGVKDLKAINVKNTYDTVVLSSGCLDLQSLVNPTNYPCEEVVIYCLERGEGGGGEGEGKREGEGEGGGGREGREGGGGGKETCNSCLSKSHVTRGSQKSHLQISACHLISSATMLIDQLGRH